jgi:hypothetical protein
MGPDGVGRDGLSWGPFSDPMAGVAPGQVRPGVGFPKAGVAPEKGFEKNPGSPPVGGPVQRFAGQGFVGGARQGAHAQQAGGGG